MNDFFSQYKDKALQSQDIDNQRQGSFEERCVKQLLAKAGVTIRVGYEKKQAQQKYGSSELDFDWFEQEFPSFPARLASEKLAHTSGRRVGWTQLFNANFAKLPWFLSYQDARIKHAWDIHNEACVLLFNAPKIGGTGVMALHNCPGVVDGYTELAETRLSRPYGNPRVIYVIESINMLLATLGTQWIDNRCNS